MRAELTSNRNKCTMPRFLFVLLLLMIFFTVLFKTMVILF